MYMDFAAAGFCLAVFSGVVWMGSVMVHDVREERQAAYFRRHEKELELKGQVSAIATIDPLCNPSKGLARRATPVEQPVLRATLWNWTQGQWFWL